MQLHALPALSRQLSAIFWAVVDALESFFLMGGEGSVLGKDLPRKAAISGKCVNTI
jgi:hypothetical protein